MKCELDTEGHCITCSDEAIAVTVRRIDQEAGVAVVSVEDTTEEVDISLIDDVVEGDVILVHGGVALGLVESNSERPGVGLAPPLINAGDVILANNGVGEARDA